MNFSLRQLAGELLPRPSMKWLGLGVAVWTLGGCLIPQDENYLNEFPIQRNRPPRIVESQVEPVERIVRSYGSDACEMTFSVIVEDPDTANRLSVYWFVDYDPSQPRQADAVSRVEPRDNKIAREDRAYFQVSFNSGELNRLNLPGDHVVEAIVSDTSLVGRDPELKPISLSDGSTFNDAGYTATYVWFVKTGNGCR
ncbi:hypothetical protein [Archangium lipolyticum]|uniref:hypothetical protein n=1 Tax=Archangium lipolyticum TaxID=2970465 RepID=UPI002149A41E|nr:hypothetical protein [Archangium lipolyticum]